MTDREQERFDKMKSLLIEAIELTKKADKTDDEDLEEEYLDRARSLYETYEEMKAQSQEEVVEDTEEDLQSIGIDEVTINEIRYLSRLLGVSMSRAVSVLLGAGVNHALKTAFRLPDDSDAGHKLEFMQISGVSPEAVRKALQKMTSDAI